MTAEITIDPLVNEVGASSVRGKPVGDRQKTAQRLLRSTAARSYDGELDTRDGDGGRFPTHREIEPCPTPNART